MKIKAPKAPFDRFLMMIGSAFLLSLINKGSPFWMDFMVTLTFTVTFWEGNYHIVEIVTAKYPGLAQTKRRILTMAGLSVIYTGVSGSVIFFVFTLISFTSPGLDSYLYTIGKGVFITAIIITVYETIFYFQLWKTSLLESERLKKAQARLQFESLKNQVNPHFLFNSLNTLSSLIHTDADRAEKFIQEFAKTYRYVLDMKDQTFVPLEDELAFVRSYIYLQKIRFDDQLVFENKITSEAKKYFIPPLVLQNLVENCIKHNVVSEKQPLTIALAIRHHVLVVKNNFQEKMGQAASTKTGLENIRQRLSMVTDQKARFYESGGYFYAEIPLIESD